MVDHAAMRRVQAASKRLGLALQERPTEPPPNIPLSLVQNALRPMIAEYGKVQKEERLKEDQVSATHTIGVATINDTLTDQVHVSSFTQGTATRGWSKDKQRGHERSQGKWKVQSQ